MLVAIEWRTRTTWVTWLWPVTWVLIPYCGLLLGGLSPRLMGLSYLDWPATLGLGSGLIFVVLVLLVAVRAAIEFSDDIPTQTEDATSEEPADASHHGRDNLPIWQYASLAVLVGGTEQFHWVFLRGALWEALLTAPDPPGLPAYWAIWIAAVVVVIETLLRRLSFEQWLVQLTALATTSILFLYTRNFWLCWILHSAIIAIMTTNGRAVPILSHGSQRPAG